MAHHGEHDAKNPDAPVEPIVLDLPESTRIYDERDGDLGGPTESDQTGDQTDGLGPL